MELSARVIPLKAEQGKNILTDWKRPSRSRTPCQPYPTDPAGLHYERQQTLNDATQRCPRGQPSELTASDTEQAKSEGDPCRVAEHGHLVAIGEHRFRHDERCAQLQRGSN